MKRVSQFKLKKLILLFVAVVVIILLYHSFPAYYYDGLHVQAQLQQLPQPSLQQQSPSIIGIKITSPTTGQQVPIGQLTISGISTDNPTTDCTVYADWNNLKPFQKAIATGPGGVNDYSTWTFTFTDKYHLITNGTNELTSKLSCISNPTNLTKWYSVNVIGLPAGQNQQQPIPIVANSTTLSNSTISGNNTAKTAALTVGAENEDILPMPIVLEEKQLPSSSTTENDADPSMSYSPSSTVTSTKSDTPSSTFAKDKGDTIIKTINQITQRISSTNPDTNPVQVQQILVQLAQTSNEEQAFEEMHQISSQVTTYPFGSVSQSLANIAQYLTSGGNVAYIMKEIIQEKSSGKSISQSLVNIALQLSCGESTNVNEHLRQIAQIIANQAGISTEKVESILIQIALQIFHSQGKVVTAQSICQIANQVAHNPNGIIAQTILQLVKQDTHDDGKSSETIFHVNKVFNSKDDNKGGRSSNEDDKNRNGKKSGSKQEFCIECVLNADIKMRIYNIAIIISKQTGVSVEAARISLSDFLVRVANDAGPSKALQSLSNLETVVTSKPIVLNKIGTIAKLYEGGYDDVANRVSDFVADKLSADPDPAVALAEVQIPEPASLPVDRAKVVDDPAKPEEGVLSFLAKTENSGEQQSVQGLKSLVLTEEKEPTLTSEQLISKQQSVQGLKSLVLTEEKGPVEVSLGIPGVGQDNIADPSSAGPVGSDSKTTSYSEMPGGFSADGISDKERAITAVVGSSDSSTDSTGNSITGTVSSITSTASTDNVGSSTDSKDITDSSSDSTGNSIT
ncbi:MAG: hypothetical protein M3250_04275, partial [Thermoproteota archaeon]|nr:hypothetical protein [Thermoproteota archaeon]